MIGKHEVIVRNRRIQYRFTVTRNITIMRGDSATGKTTLIDMIQEYQTNGEASGVSVLCDKRCVVLLPFQWEVNLAQIKDSIVFIDEGDPFITSTEFAHAIRESDNYYVIATRNPLYTLPYSVKEVYGIKNKSGNRYQGTKRLYSEFYPLNDTNVNVIEKPNVVIVEDSNSGYEFVKSICDRYGIKCITASGKSNVFRLVQENKNATILVMADGAAFGPEVENLLKLRSSQNITIYLPESFEWLILKSGIVKNVLDIIDEPAKQIESSKYFSWEQFFTSLLVDKTKDTYLAYNKKNLNEVYLQKKEKEAILDVMPKMEWL